MLWIILIIALAAGYWLAVTDLPRAFAPGAATGMIPRRQLSAVIAVCILLGGFLWGRIPAGPMESALHAAGGYRIAMMMGAAVVAAYATRRLCGTVAPVYALTGAVAGWTIATRPEMTADVFARMPLAWVAAPLAAALLAAVFARVYSRTTQDSGVHLLRLTHRLRTWTVGATVLLAVAVGVNNGGLVMALLSGVTPDFSFAINTLYINEAQALWVGVALAVAVMAAPRFLSLSASEGDAWPDTPAALCAMTASALAMLFFSFPATAEAVGMTCTPLGAPLLLAASAVGAGWGRRRSESGSKGLSKRILSVFAAAASAFGISYAGSRLLAGDSAAGTPASAAVASHQYNLTAPVLALLLTAALAAALVLMRKRQKDKVKAYDETLAQQRQLFEKQKDITALEIRQVLIENESLSHRLELRRGELINIALNITEQKDFLEALHASLRDARATDDATRREELLGKVEEAISRRMNFSQESESLYAQVETLHQDFSLRLSEKYPRLTPQERKMTILLRLGFQTKYIATLMNISPKSVDIGRYRLRTKFGLEREQKLAEFIKTI